MVITRGHHFATSLHMPDASWAIFFLIGFYTRPGGWLPALLALAGFLDYSAITWGGVSRFCVSPAYWFLLPAYTVMWFSGRWYATHYTSSRRSIFPLLLSVLGGTALCELLTSGSFYFLSGRFTNTSIIEFATRFIDYFPSSLQAVVFYIGLAAMIHIIIEVLTCKRSPTHHTTNGH